MLCCCIIIRERENIKPCPGTLFSLLPLSLSAGEGDKGTGSTSIQRELAPKRLQLLRESIPTAVRFACSPTGKWRLCIARPCLPMTNASPSMANRPNRSTPKRRSWRPSSWRNLRHVKPRSRPQPPRQSRSGSRPRQPRSQRNCVIGCVQACCARARRGAPPGGEYLCAGRHP